MRSLLSVDPPPGLVVYVERRSQVDISLSCKWFVSSDVVRIRSRDADLDGGALTACGWRKVVKEVRRSVAQLGILLLMRYKSRGCSPPPPPHFEAASYT